MEVLIRRRVVGPTGASVVDGEPMENLHEKVPSKLSERADSPRKFGDEEYGVGELAPFGRTRVPLPGFCWKPKGPPISRGKVYISKSGRLWQWFKSTTIDRD